MSNTNRDTELNDSAIAIVGMAGRFPDARNVDQFWRNIRDGHESIRPLDDDALRAAGVPQGLLDDPNYVKVGVELPDMEKFDARFFGLSPLDASIMDPQHRHFLECSWEVLESAGYDPASFPGSIGVFAGSGHNAYMPRNLLTNPDLVDQVGFFLLRHTGNDKDFLATRASYQLDLKGPSVNVQTACSTSLVAVHLACQSLLSGECDMALAGAVTIEMPHRRGYLTREGEILSTDGHCRPFEARSNGTLFGSAAAMVALRRLEDAEEDGDTILAVIRGSAVNNDGSGKIGYLAPSVDGQAAAIAEAIQIAEVDPASIRFVEAHGTGTAVGDPIEVAALSQAFGEQAEPQKCALGSVKSNIGHTDTAAGVAGMIKAIQAMRHQQLPPTLHFEQPNPEIDFASSPFYVSGELAPWPDGEAPRRAGVSSLGVGGTNAHVVLEEWPARRGGPSSRALQLLPLAARSEAALENATDRLADHLRAHPDLELADVAYTLQKGRRGFQRRRFVVAGDGEAAVDLLDARVGDAGQAATEPLSVTFMFPGGGAQYPNMGRGLYDAEPIYREHVDALLATLDAEAEQQLRGLLFPDPGEEERAALELQRPSLQLPLIFITEYALARLWMSWGVEPTALIGHSMGENTAACLAGVIRPADALALVSLRGQLFERVPAGGMLSISLDADAVRELLGPELCVASVNAPELCVASGPRAALAALAAELEAREVSTQHIQIDVAAHSEMLDAILDDWRAFLSGLELSPPQIPFISNLTGTWIREEEATDPEYWVRHLRGCVRFADGVACLLEDSRRALLEVGPGRTLAVLAGMQAGPQRHSSNSMRHPEDNAPDLAFLVGALGRLWLAGVEIDWRAFHGDDERVRIPLPTYAFDHERHWIEPGTTLHDEGAPRGELQRHDALDAWFHTPAWKRTPSPSPLKEGSPVLLYAKSDALSDALTARLREGGSRVITVAPGASFERLGPDAFAIRPASADDCEAMLEALIGEGGTPRVIAHAWNVGRAPAADQLLDQYRHERDLGFSSLLALAQALGSLDVDDPIELVALSSGMQQVGGESPDAPLRALMLGPCRVIGAEYPNVRCRSVDLEMGDSGGSAQARLLDVLVEELGAGSEETVLAYRGGRRLTQTFEPMPLTEPTSRAPMRERGVYLITGGLGGLGGVLAEHLATRHDARLVLLGRSPLPDREEWAQVLESRPASDRTAGRIRQVQAIEAAGGEVMLACADVCDADALRGVVAEARERFGSLHGIYHTAGVLDDALAQLKSLDEAERVLAPKVRGTLALAEATRGLTLDFFALYSSVSALAGLPGQIDYAAASSFLDAFARHRSAAGEGGPTVSIAWGPWQQVGMAAELARAEGVAAGRGEAEPLGHVLLESYLGQIPGGELYATDFSVGRHWLLDEHRLAEGDALIPGTGYLELAAAALESRPEDRAIELSDIFLAAPFMVPDEGERQLRLQLERGSGEFVFLSGTPGAQNEIEHVRGVVRYCDRGEQAKHPLAEIRARCEAAEAGSHIANTESHLRFGPRWDCIRQLAYGQGEAVADLALPESFAGDLPGLHLHPAMLDMATGCAHALMPGYDPKREFCVPMSYSRVFARGPLPPTFVAHIRLRPETQGEADFAVFDVTLMDEDGGELACFEEFMVKRIQSRGDLVATAVELATGTSAEPDDEAAEHTSPLADSLAQATRPEEGLAALDRLLAAGPLEHVIVLPHDLSAWIAHMSAANAPPVSQAAGPTISPELLAELALTEDALKAHDAVADAAMTAHFDRPGQTRRLAHIVWDAEQHATVSELRRYLRERVADDLLPQNFVELEDIPRDDAGEVDREALDDPYGIADDYLPPRTNVEKTIARVWQETLRIDRVGLHDNFFDIGGHSLLAMRAIVRTEKKLGVRLNNAIMVLQTLEQVAAECAKRMPESEDTEPGDAPAPEAAAPEEKSTSLSSRLLRAVRRG